MQRLRAEADAIVVGSGTVVADDPQLICRLRGRTPGAWRVAVDSRGRLPAGARILSDEYAAQTVVATTEAGSSALAARLQKEARHATWILPPGGEGHVDLGILLERLTSELGAMEVLCEGGGELAGALLRAALVDRLVLFYAPVILGDASARPGFAGLDLPLSAGRLTTASRSVRTFGDDVVLTFDLAATPKEKQ